MRPPLGRRPFLLRDSLTRMVSAPVEQQVSVLVSGCVDVVRLDDLRQRVERSRTTGTPLVVKVGFDPTAPDLHLGHTVLIRKMKDFQDLGHRVFCGGGHSPAMMGYRRAQTKPPPPLSPEEIARNAETYK